jgi:hypothetical protein
MEVFEEANKQDQSVLGEGIEEKGATGYLADIFGAIYTSAAKSTVPSGLRDIILGDADIGVDTDQEEIAMPLLQKIFPKEWVDNTVFIVGGGKVDRTAIDAMGVYRGRGDNPFEGIINQVFFGHRVKYAENSPMLRELMGLSEQGYTFVPSNYVDTQSTYLIPEDNILSEKVTYGKMLEGTLEYVMGLEEYQMTTPRQRLKMLDQANKELQGYYKDYMEEAGYLKNSQIKNTEEELLDLKDQGVDVAPIAEVVDEIIKSKK